VWSAVAELWLASLCARAGFAIELHPLAPSGKRPDFRAVRSDARLVLEVASLVAPQRDDLSDRLWRFAQDKFLTEHQHLRGHVLVTHKAPIPGGFASSKLVGSIIQHYTLAQTGAQTRFRTTVDGVGFDYHFIALEGELPGLGVGWMKGAESIGEAPRIRDVVLRKASDYKIKDEPFVVAIDSQDWFRVRPGQVNRALYGDTTINIRIPTDGSETPSVTSVGRNQLGLFKSGRHLRVSAVIFHQSLWSKGDGLEHKMFVYHNAYARHPLSEAVFQGYPQFVPRDTERGAGRYEWVDGPGDDY